MKYKYRIIPRIFGFEPQMRCNTTKTGKLFWTPLNAEGYWADPTSCDTGVVCKRSKMGLIAALRSVKNARVINEQNALL